MNKANVICSKFWDAKLFIWNGKVGAAFTSDLPENLFCPVYNDACDMGFGVSGKTRNVVFAMDRVRKDDDGDIQYWTLKSISEAGFSILIYND